MSMPRSRRSPSVSMVKQSRRTVINGWISGHGRSPTDMNQRSWEKPHPAFLIVFLFLFLLFYLPIAGVLIRGLFPEGRFDGKLFFETVGSPYILRVVGFTFLQALVSTIF